MKKTIFFFWLALSLSQTAQGEEYYSYDNYSYSYRENWEIDSFNSEIFINQNGKIEINETIAADFTNEAHRGIERSIPYEYSNDYNSRISFEKAKNEKGENWATNVFKEFGYLYIQMTTKDDSQMSWPATFKLKYTAENVISFFDTHDEFYWNVNGTDWVVPTKNVTAKIHLPKEFETDELNFACYTGIYNSPETSCNWLIEDKKTISFKTARPLEVGEGLTIVLGMPKGTIEKPPALKKAWWFLQDNPFTPAAPLVLIFMIILWIKYGRDDQAVKDTIVPTFTTPQNLKPTEVGTIIDETIHPRDITATIIYFAIKGFIKITDINNDDFELELRKPYITDGEFEKKVLSGIFDENKKGQKKKISSLKNHFYTHVSGIKTSVINQLIEDDYFKSDPETTRALYYGTGGFISIFAITMTGTFLSPASTLSVILSGIIIMLFGKIMPRKTTKGTETYYQLKGLYEYIDTAEKDRMKFQEDKKILFEKLLPYAMAFGLVKKWTKAFDGIYKNPPSWYTSTTPWTNRPFTMMYLSDQLNSFGKETTSNITSRPGGGGSGAWGGGSGFSSGGFGGGGFSGGGFGGGGGRGL